MRTEFMLGEHFLTRYELYFSECVIPQDTLFTIVEVLEDDDYKVHFDKCIYDEGFKAMCKSINCEHNNEDGNVQICSFDEIDDFRMSAMAEY